MTAKDKEKEEWFIDFTSDFIIDEYHINGLTIKELEETINTVVDNKDLAIKVFEKTCSKLVRKVA